MQAAGSERSKEIAKLQDIFELASRGTDCDYLSFKGAFTDGGVDESRYEYW